MKHAIVMLLFAAFAAVPAFAQAPATKPAAKPAQPAAAPADPKPAESVKLATGKGPSRANEDARECLKLPTNSEIIKCAEQYL